MHAGSEKPFRYDILCRLLDLHSSEATWSDRLLELQLEVLLEFITTKQALAWMEAVISLSGGTSGAVEALGAHTVSFQDKLVGLQIRRAKFADQFKQLMLWTGSYS